MSFHAVRVMCSMGLLWLLFGNQPKHSLNPMIYVWMAHHTNKRFVTKFMCCVLTVIFQTIVKPAKKETSNLKTIDMTELSIYSFIISSVWLLYLFFVFRNGRRVPIIKWWSTLSTCDYNLQKSRNVNSAMTKLKKCSFPWNSWEELNHVTWCSTFTSSFISSFLFDLKSKKQSVI